jgi:hypothetical protein
LLALFTHNASLNVCGALNQHFPDVNNCDAMINAENKLIKANFIEEFAVRRDLSVRLRKKTDKINFMCSRAREREREVSRTDTFNYSSHCKHTSAAAAKGVHVACSTQSRISHRPA